jgi:Fe-S cluster assembly scaffold protein SufB
MNKVDLKKELKEMDIPTIKGDQIKKSHIEKALAKIIDTKDKKEDIKKTLKGLGIPRVKGDFFKKSAIIKALARVVEIEKEYKKVKADMDKLV